MQAHRSILERSGSGDAWECGHGSGSMALSGAGLPASRRLASTSSRCSSSHSRTSRSARSGIEPRITAPSLIAMRRLDREGLTARNVNKHRQVLATMFRYACRVDTYSQPWNPVDPTDKRPEPPPAALDYFEVEEAEALARAAAAGAHQTTERDKRGVRDDLQDAELYRVL